jgi:hypothetical protein
VFAGAVCIAASFTFAAPRIITIGPSGNNDHGMRAVRTKHYDIRTDLEPALVSDLSTRMDTMYDEYCRRLSDFSPPNNAPPLPVFLFSREADYEALTHSPNSGGMFVVPPKGKPFLTAYLESQGRDELRRTLQHEALHQFAYFAISDRIPVWLNEGIAQLFEEGIWTGRTFTLGQIPPRRVRQLQADMNAHRLVNFKKFFAVTSPQWQMTLARDADASARYYNQAWAMTYFLTESNTADYRARLIDFLKRLHTGEDAVAAFNAAFSDNIDGFQDRFVQWALTIQPTPEATLIERQETLGDFLIFAETKDQKFADMAEFRNWVVGHSLRTTYSKGKLRWQTSETPQIYFSDLTGRTYADGELFFQPASSGSLPDMLCLASSRYRLRTHFYREDGKTQHEVLIEPTS